MDVDEEAYHSKFRPSSAGYASVGLANEGFCEKAISTKISCAGPKWASS